jgi:hypothetical protein
VTRLIRTAYGDYQLQSIPPGLAIPVPWKSVERQKAKGSLRLKKNGPRPQKKAASAAPIVQWVKGFQS